MNEFCLSRGLSLTNGFLPHLSLFPIYFRKNQTALLQLSPDITYYDKKIHFILIRCDPR